MTLPKALTATQTKPSQLAVAATALVTAILAVVGSPNAPLAIALIALVAALSILVLGVMWHFDVQNTKIREQDDKISELDGKLEECEGGKSKLAMAVALLYSDETTGRRPRHRRRTDALEAMLGPDKAREAVAEAHKTLRESGLETG